jgi:uncharacterized protein (TIGR03437 family)
MLRFSLLLAGASVAFAQQYTISTIAGGAPPATPAAASNTSIGAPRRVATDRAGNVYFSSSHTVFKMSGATLTVVAGNSRAGFSGDGGPAVNAQLNSPEGVAVDASGNVFIADSANNRVRKVDTSGIITTYAGNGTVSQLGPGSFGDGGTATDATLHLPTGLAVDKSGTLFIADTGNNAVRKVGTDGIIQLVAGDSYASYAGDGGSGPSAELHSPTDVAVDSAGNTYISDTANAAIRKVDTGGIITTFAGNAKIGTSGDGGAATSASLVAPLAVAVDSAGNLYLVQNGDSRIRKVDTKGIITTVAGNGTPGFAGDGGAPDKAQFNFPTGIASDASGNLYIADSLNLRIRKIAGSSVSTIAGNGVLSSSGNGGPARNAQMDAPQGVAVDASGNVYISDTANNTVRKVAKDGTITVFAGGSGDTLSRPQGLAVDSSGNVYVAEAYGARVRKYSPSGSGTTVAGSGTSGYGGDNGSATAAQLYTPSGVAVDSAGNVYIADFSNNRVRKVSPSGAITTVAGTGGSGYSGDGGPATNARLNIPSAVTVDSGGNLYIADTGNNRIRIVTPAGTINTVAGNGLPGYSGDGGTATSAQVGNPVGIAVDAAGNLYISDGSTRIRKVYTSGLILTIAGGATPGYSGDGGQALNAQLSAPSALSIDATGNLYVADTANNAVRLLQVVGFGLSLKAVTNGASNLSGGLAPGEVVVLYGSGMGPGGLVQSQLNTAGRVPTTLAGTRVFFNSTPAPILYTSASQVGVIVPFGINSNSAQIVVQYQDQIAAAVVVNTTPAAPGIFTLNATGSGQAIAFAPNGALNGADRPAAPGSFLTFYATGIGQTNPQSQDGIPAAVPLPQPVLQVTATIGGKAATVQYAGAAPGIVAGVTQVNLQVPSGLTPGPQPVVLQVGGISTQGNVTIAVQ